ncbi:hypothetical protein CKM354_000361900 [Cercospora kikuchii]|uniref:Cytochrome b5 heme-binding domain-containing protein n=1 Tax=Cercospora kikuchii TaxID=84275 RepID=A0A9P3CKQ6_9PEZI|nr:uncharacterized protein CKM354_000361900 [Cercospora kikuchii]GIZ40273.1 hypothetical protein CKM354_000361900 [Cercospora kikuchii]
MGALSLILLLLTVATLAYQYPHMLKNFLPAWLAAPGANEEGATKSSAQNRVDDELSEGDATPKAKSQASPDDVPTFTLNEETEDNALSEHEPVAPSFPAINSAQRASSMPPPPLPAAQTRKPVGNGGSNLMPPPSRPTPGIRPSAAAGLRVPSIGPLPNRGPPTGSQQRVSSGLTANGTAKSTPNPRNKVLLKPGHSPMDWAALTKQGNISGVSTFQRVTPSQLKTMTGRKGKPAWSSWQGKVYNITPYLPFHPGGEAELMKAAGRDGTKLFMDVHPWVNWENMLGTCLVGILVPENYGQEECSSLEDMD